MFYVISGKSLPIRCVVEQYTTGSTGTPVNGERPQQPTLRETDTYAILPANTPFCEIVRTALVKIGYAAPEAMGAKGKKADRVDQCPTHSHFRGPHATKNLKIKFILTFSKRKS